VKINLPVTGRNVDVALDEGRQSQRNSEDVAGVAGDLRLLAREFWARRQIRD
jgi:aerotaxis receptor